MSLRDRLRFTLGPDGRCLLRRLGKSFLLQPTPILTGLLFRANVSVYKQLQRVRGMVNAKKSTQDILQEEILRERAAVLARAGERLTEALDVLRKIEREIGEREAAWIHGPGMEGPSAPPQENEGRRQLVCEMNRKIQLAKNLPTMACQGVMGMVSNSSMVPKRRSSDQSRIATAGANTM